MMFVGSVSCELGGHCVDNVLFWNTYRGDAQTRDCSVLHTNAGVTYKGICKIYDGGAGCWKINGTVDHAYIMESRKKYDAIINPVVTTTTIAPSIINLQCPECPVCSTDKKCDDSDYLAAMRYLNATLEDCKIDKRGLEEDYNSRISKVVYNDAMADFDKKVAGYKNETEAARSELQYEKDWSNFYKYGIYFCCVFVSFMVYIWVKKPQLEDD